MKINQINSWYSFNFNKLKSIINIILDNIIKANLTSYEIVWATARKPPNKEYFELEDQPAIIIV